MAKFKGRFWTPRMIDWILVVIFGLFLTAALVASIFTKYGEYAFGAILVAALFWAAIEIATPASKHWANALLRFIPALLAGMVIGGVLTYYTQFGFYIVEPALSGDYFAVFALAGVLVLTLTLIWDAVWSHQKQYVKR